MKRIFKNSVFIGILLSLLMLSTVFGASTTKSLTTNFTLVNVSDQDATGSIMYVNEDGTLWEGSSITKFGPTEPYQLPADGGQLVVRQYTDTIYPGRGSVAISSDVPLGAVVQQRLAPGDLSLPTSGAYLGVTEGSTKFYVPLIQARKTTSTGIGNTFLAIQNISSTTIPTISVNLLAEPGSGSLPSTFTKTINNLQPNASFFYDLADESGIQNNWSGSAEIISDSGKITVVVNSFNGSNALRTFNAFPVESVNSKWGIPLFASKLSNGLNTSVSLQNLSGGTIPVNGVTLDCGAGFSMKNNVEIPNKGNYAFNPLTNYPQIFPNNWQGACTLDSGSYDIVAFVIMRRIINNGDQAAYEAISYSSTDTSVFVPLAAKRLPNGFATSIVIQNLSSEDTIVNLTWTPSPTECALSPCNSYSENGITIPGNGNIVRNLRLPDGGPIGMPNGWQGTLKVVPSNISNAKPISGYVVLSNLVNTAGDNYRAHLALTLP